MSKRNAKPAKRKRPASRDADLDAYMRKRLPERPTAIVRDMGSGLYEVTLRPSGPVDAVAQGIVTRLAPELLEPRCGFVPPTPGFAPCTRPPHKTGPCAHPLLGLRHGDVDYTKPRSRDELLRGSSLSDAVAADNAARASSYGRPNWGDIGRSVAPVVDAQNDLARVARKLGAAALRSGKPAPDGTAHATGFADGWDAAIAYLEKGSNR